MADCVMARLVEDVDAVLEGREPTYEDVNERLPYFQVRGSDRVCGCGVSCNLLAANVFGLRQSSMVLVCRL